MNLPMRPGVKGVIFSQPDMMQNEFTAVIERDADWFVAFSPEVRGANGQGKTRDEALSSLADAIALILEDRREDGLRSVPAHAERTTVRVAA